MLIQAFLWALPGVWGRSPQVAGGLVIQRMRPAQNIYTILSITEKLSVRHPLSYTGLSLRLMGIMAQLCGSFWSCSPSPLHPHIYSAKVFAFTFAVAESMFR